MKIKTRNYVCKCGLSKWCCCTAAAPDSDASMSASDSDEEDSGASGSGPSRLRKKHMRNPNVGKGPAPEYVIRWSVNLQLKHNINIAKTIDSLPFVVWTAKRQDFEAEAFIKRVFGGEEQVTTTAMAVALDMKFRQIASIPPRKQSAISIATDNEASSQATGSTKKKASSATRRFVKALNSKMKEHLLERLVAKDGWIKTSNFMELPVAIRHNGEVACFYEWFFGLPKLISNIKLGPTVKVTSLYYELWEMGLIWYCSKEKAENLLKDRHGTFMVRVSDTEFETFKISALRSDRTGKNNFELLENNILEVDHYPCYFYDAHEPLENQMVQQLKFLNMKYMLQWAQGDEPERFEFEQSLKNDKFDCKKVKAIYEKMAKMQLYEPNDGKHRQIQADGYHRNQKPFGTGAYLHLRWWKKKNPNPSQTEERTISEASKKRKC